MKKFGTFRRLYIVILSGLLATQLSVAEFSIEEKVEGKTMPSIAAPWTEWFVNRPGLSYSEMTTFHDMFWSPEFGLRFQRNGTEVQLVGDFSEARRQRDELLALNPNMILLLGIAMRGDNPESPHVKGLYGDNFPWVRDNEDMVEGSADYVDFLIDFVHPIAQQTIVKQAIAVANSGLWDGIFFDFWQEGNTILSNYRTLAAEQAARVNILHRIRAAVGNDFLIIVNPNAAKTELAAPYINGLFMETYRALHDNYSPDGLKAIESTLLWAEENLQEPRINCLKAEGIGSQLPMSPENLQSMRCLTTLYLTHSNGYFLYTVGVQWDERHPHDRTYLDYQGPAFHRNPSYWITHREQHDTFPHRHANEYWHDFYDADLGQPIGEKAQLYQNRRGLFIREFTNGWAVYNRSGRTHNIQFPEQVSGVASGREEKFWHEVPDLDGEIYLKIPEVPQFSQKLSQKPEPPRVDLNADGVVNVLDLIIVANAFGTQSEADINGDGTVNVLDLISVAQRLD